MKHRTASLAIFAAVVSLPAVALQDVGSQEPKALERYKGREIARTMHWSGAEWLMRETREKEENSELMLSKLGIEPGDVVCDLGSGSGFHTLRLAKMVGEEGKVFAVDIQPQMLSLLESNAKKEGVTGIETILGSAWDPKIPPESCDLILLVDVYHELAHPEPVLTAIRKALKPDGRLVLVEFRTEDPEVPIKKLHKMSKAQMLNELPANGLAFASEFDGLPWQHLMFFRADAGLVEEPTRQPEDVAFGFYRALASGDVATMGAFYADEVEVGDGSELLKTKWGGADDDRKQATVRRAELLRRYRALIDSVTAEKWREVFPTSETTSLRSLVVEEGDDPESAGTVLEMTLTVNGPDETWRYVFHPTSEGRWEVDSETADY